LGVLWFLDNGYYFFIGVKFNYPVPLWIGNFFCKYNCSRFKISNSFRKIFIKNIIPQNHGYIIVTNEIFTYNECIRKTTWLFLNLIGKFYSKLFSATQKIEKMTCIIRRNND